MHWVTRARNTGIFSALVWGSASAVLAASLLNTVTRLRMFELRDNLQAANEKSDDLRNVTLLSRVALINQRAFSGGRETAASYRQEAESALIAIRQSKSRDRHVSLSDRMALPFLNGLNRVLGLPKLKLGRTPEQELVLDLAFQFESFREYGKAVRGYTVYLSDFHLTADERDFALLHRGFCEAMQNNFDAAMNDFAVVEKSATRRNAETALKLSSFLRALRDKIKIIEAIKDPARRGEMYYEAAAYFKALENFAQIEENRRSDRIRFYTARSYEETGQTTKALAIYRELVRSASGSQYALNANRRMYLLGTFLGNDAELARESKKNSETVIKDKEFIAAVTHLEKSATVLHTEAAAETAERASEITAVQKLVLPEEPPPPIKPTPAPEPVLPPETKITPPTAVPAAPKPVVVDLRNEREARRAENLSQEKREALIRKQTGKIDKLTMDDGNIFYGVVFKEDKEKIYLFSMLGNLELLRADVVKREKVQNSPAGR